MDFGLDDQEFRSQKWARDFCLTRRRCANSPSNLLTVEELFREAREYGFWDGCPLNGQCPRPESIALFLAIEQVTRYHPELAFTLAYYGLCNRVASLLFDEGARKAPLCHMKASRCPFDTLLIWRKHEGEAALRGPTAKIDRRNKRLCFADPLLPASSGGNAFVLGWTEADSEGPVAFWVPFGSLTKCDAKPIRGVGLKGISFQQIKCEAALQDKCLTAPLQSCLEANSLLEAERTIVYGAVISGLLQLLLEYTVDYALRRKTFGKALVLHQAVAVKLSEMKVEIEAIRLALMDMMHRISRNGVVYSGRALGQCLMQIAMRVSTQALQILGGHGLLDEHPVEKWVRDIQMLRAFVL